MTQTLPHPYIQYVEKGLNKYADHAFESKKRYFNYLFNCQCAGDLLNTGVFPNAKELTESFGAFMAVKKYFRKTHLLDDGSIIVHIIADGSTPRTAVLFAFLTKWQVVSIDPNMREEWLEEPSPVDRLTCYRDTVEDIAEHLSTPNIIVAVHPHVPYIVIRDYYPITPIVAIPCCVPYPDADISYTDHGIWSPENKVMIYKVDKNNQGVNHVK